MKSKSEVRKPRTMGNVLNYIHNSIDTAYWVVRPLATAGIVPTATKNYLRNVHGFVVAANLASNLINASEANDKKPQTATA